MITLDAIELPPDMDWPNRIVGWAIGQDIQTTVTGSLIVQQSERQAGRPITLRSVRGGRSDGAIVTFATVQALQAAVDAGDAMTLTIPSYDGPAEVFSVMFDQANPIEAAPWDWWRAKPAPDDRWAITLNFIVVE